ncbi:MAG: hypothetical protein V4625_07575 [Pseudomonadota bacterium]
MTFSMTSFCCRPLRLSAKDCKNPKTLNNECNSVFGINECQAFLPGDVEYIFSPRIEATRTIQRRLNIFLVRQLMGIKKECLKNRVLFGIDGARIAKASIHA